MSETTPKNPPRILELPKRRWYNPKTWLSNQPLPPRQPISPVSQLWRKTIGLLKREPKTFLGVAVIYAVSVFILVRSFTVSSSFGDLTLGNINNFGDLVTRANDIFSVVALDASDSLTAASGVYQIMIMTICCLALIWAFRQVLSGEKAGLKNSFYKGMTPMVPYLIVLLFVGINLIPTAVAGYLLTLLISTGALYWFELTLAVLVFLLFVFWSMYLLTHTITAFFVVTLPEMTPIKAIRSAKKLVYKRRLLIWRKIVASVLFLAVLVILLMAPFIVWLPAGAPWVFFILTALFLPLSQAFLYTLYREIL